MANTPPKPTPALVASGKLQEAQRQQLAASAKYGESGAVAMAIPGPPVSADRQLINRLVERHNLNIAEMGQFIEAVMREHPVLVQLANARQMTSVAAQRRALLDVLDRMRVEEGLPHEVVADGVVQAARNDPENFASIRSRPGWLQIERSAYWSVEILAREITHEIGYFFLRRFGSVPVLQDTHNGVRVLDFTIQNGGRYFFAE
jgi:hypothetical protein